MSSLLKDLNELVEKNIISADTASQITNYYENKKNSSPGAFSAVLAILGALLLGSGACTGDRYITGICLAN